MSKESEEFIEYIGNKDDFNDLDEVISEFEKLSTDVQYEVLIEESKGKIKGFQANLLFSNKKIGTENRGIGIVSLLNSKFPRGIKLEGMKAEIPEELYGFLTMYQPEGEKGKINSIIEGLDVFRDENGELDKQSVTDYLSDPKVLLFPADLENVFQFFDKNSDRENIFKIIEGRILRRFGDNKDNSTNYINAASGFSNLIKVIQNLNHSSAFNIIKDMLEFERTSNYDDEKQGDFNMQHTIATMYTSFAKLYKEGYDINAIKSDFAVCVYTAYEGLVDKAMQQSEQLLSRIEGFKHVNRDVERGDKGGIGEDRQ